MSKYMFDVFISHSSKDKTVADALKDMLEASSVRTWKAPDNILPGQVWEEAITGAISVCKITLLIWSTDSQDSQQVKRELTLAASMNKVIIPFRIQDLKPEGTFAYYLSNTHWLDAFSQDAESGIREAVDRVNKILGALYDTKKPNTQVEEVRSSSILDEEIEHKSEAEPSNRIDLNGRLIDSGNGAEAEGDPEILDEKNQLQTSRRSDDELTWQACRKRRNKLFYDSEEKIILTHQASGSRIELTVDIKEGFINDKGIYSLNGKYFEASPLGSDCFYAEDLIQIDNHRYSLYLSFSKRGQGILDIGKAMIVDLTELNINNRTVLLPFC